MLQVNPGAIQELASAAGFEIAGVASAAAPVPDFDRYTDWVARGHAGAMGYLADHRAALRGDIHNLLPSAQSVICVGKLYNGPEPYSTNFSESDRGWISRYAWGADYHGVLRERLERLAHALEEIAGPFEWRACVDTAPVLERSLARQAGLGWIGKNTCLINQDRGSWFFLGELITSLDISSSAAVPPDRCGTCRRCIEACPTAAIVPAPEGNYEIDARRCISYLTIELRGAIDEQLRGRMGHQIFGCDICQDVCPWNREAARASEPAFEAARFAPSLEKMAALTEPEFREMFRFTPVDRARYRGFLRNVCVAMGNSGVPRMLEPLRTLQNSPDPVIASHADWAVAKLQAVEDQQPGTPAGCSELHFSS